MRRFNRLLLTCLAVSVIGLPAVAADDWARFRGPNGSGVSDATTVPVKFGKADYNWRVELPGEGYGSPVVVGNKLFVVCAKPNTAERMLVCLDATTGKQLWSRTWASKTYKLHRYNHYGTTTPAADTERVYMYWVNDANVTLKALDHDGQEKWSQDLGPFDSSHGGGTSPMLYKDLVIVTSDQRAAPGSPGKPAIYAFKRDTGKQVWKLDRSPADNGTSYGVPCIYKDKEGNDQLIVGSKGDGVTGIDPMSGKVIWQMKDLFSLRVVASPIVAGDLVFSQMGSGGGGKRFVGVRPGSAASKPNLEVDLNRSIPYVPTPLYYKGHLYFVHDGGQAACLNPRNGDVVWNERIGNGVSFFGSPVCVNGVIYAISREGQCVTFKATPDGFDLIAINDLGEKSFATPAVANGRMYLRTFTHVISVGGKKVN